MKDETFRRKRNNSVYVLVDPRKPKSKWSYWTFDGQPFYVGRSSNLSNRTDQHFSDVPDYQKNPFKRAVINKIEDCGLEVGIKVVSTGLTIKQANSLEKRLIALIGRRSNGVGPLTNLTDGGDGGLGSKRSEASKKRMAEYTHRKWLPSHLLAIQTWSPVFAYVAGYTGRHATATYNCVIHGKVQHIASEVSRAIRNGRCPCPRCGKLIRVVNIGNGKRGDPMFRTTPKNHTSVMKKLFGVI